jgi:hypothetical protein
MATSEENEQPPTSARRDTGQRESDVADDDAQALQRVTGGAPDAEGEDAQATTGAGPSGSFVGREAGEDAGYAGETGAERRATST